MSSRSTVLPPFSLMYVPAGEIHATDFGMRGACCFFAAVDESWMGNRVHKAKIDPRTPRITISRSYLQAFALKIYEEFRTPDSLSDMVVEGTLLELLGRWFREEFSSHHHAPGWLSTVRTMLHDSFCGPITLCDLSREVGIHPSHLAREFHRVYGVTIGEHIRELRIDFVAEKLLVRGKNEVAFTDLALQAGFSSHAHMSSVFKRVTGMTPSQYKRAHEITSSL